MQVELTTNPTQDQVHQADLDKILYHGVSVDKCVYEAVDYGTKIMDDCFGEGKYEGQESYLGYDPKTDTFYIAVEGNMEVEDEDCPGEMTWADMDSHVFAIKVKGESVVWEHLTHFCVSFYSVDFDRQRPYDKLRESIPTLLDVRLD